MTQEAFEISQAPSVLGFFQRLLSPDFMPHGHCYFWRPDILWLHLISDLFITLAYYSIPVTLVYFVHKRRDVPFNWIFLMFGAFIFLCGTTHIMDVLTTFIPVYRVEGLIKLLTALVSVTTAVLLIPLVPKALALRSPKELEALNQHLQMEIQERRLAEQRLTQQAEALTQTNTALEQFHSMAIGREQQMVELKRRINELSLALGRPAPYDLSFVRDKPTGEPNK